MAMWRIDREDGRCTTERFAAVTMVRSRGSLIGAPWQCGRTTGTTGGAPLSASLP